MANEKIHNLGTEATVGSVAGTDRVMVYDSQGTLRPVAFEKLTQLVRESIQIGGRNLLTGSMTSVGGTSDRNYIFEDGVHSIIMVKGGIGIFKQIGSFPLTTYAVSLELRADAPMIICWYLANNEQSKCVWNITTEWERYTAVVLPTQCEVQFRLTSNDYTHRFYARYPKIEQGNIATGWTPAPEDLIGGGNSQTFKELQGYEIAIPTKAQTFKRPRRKIKMFNFNLN